MQNPSQSNPKVKRTPQGGRVGSQGKTLTMPNFTILQTRGDMQSKLMMRVKKVQKDIQEKVNNPPETSPKYPIHEPLTVEKVKRDKLVNNPINLTASNERVDGATFNAANELDNLSRHLHRNEDKHAYNMEKNKPCVNKDTMSDPKVISKAQEPIVHLDDQHISFIETLKNCAARIIINGTRGCGKTTLTQSLLCNANQLQQKENTNSEKTVDCFFWNPTSDLSATVFDIGGHDKVKQQLLRLFHTNSSNNICVILHELGSEEYEPVCNILSDILLISPLSNVIFGLTKSDMLSDSETKTSVKNFQQHVCKFIDDEIWAMKHNEMKVENEKDRDNIQTILGAYDTVKANIENQSIINTVTTHTDNGLLSMRTSLLKLVSKQTKPFLDDEDRLLCLKLIKSESGQLPIAQWGDQEKQQDRRYRKLPYIMYDQDVYKTFQGHCEVHEKTKFKTIVKSLHSLGIVAWFHTDPILRQYIFTDVLALYDMLYTLLEYNTRPYQELSKDDKILVSRKNITERCYNEFVDKLYTEGLLAKQLLEIMVKPFSFDEHVQALTMLLQYLHIAFDVPTGITPSLFFPWYIQSKVILSSIAEAVSEIKVQNRTLYQMQMDIKGFIPRTYFYKICSLLHIYLNLDLNPKEIFIWGGNFYMRKNNVDSLLQHFENSQGDDVITIYIASPLDEQSVQEVWKFLLGITKELRPLKSTIWPGLIRDCYFYCRHCLLKGSEEIAEPHLWSLEEIVDIRMKMGYIPDGQVFYCPKQRRISGESSLPAPMMYPIVEGCDASRCVTEIKAYLEKKTTCPVNSSEENEGGKFRSETDATFTQDESHKIWEYLAPNICRIQFEGGGGTGMVIGTLKNHSQQHLSHKFLLTCKHVNVQEAFINNKDCFAEFKVSDENPKQCYFSVKIMNTVIAHDDSLDYTLLCLEPSSELDCYLKKAMKLNEKIVKTLPSCSRFVKEPLILIGHWPNEKKVDHAVKPMSHDEVHQSGMLNASMCNTHILGNDKFILYQCHMFEGSSGGPVISKTKDNLYAMHCGGTATMGLPSITSKVEYGVRLWEVIKHFKDAVVSKGAVTLPNGPKIDIDAVKEMFPQLF